MKTFLKANIYFVILLLMIQLIPGQALANETVNPDNMIYPEVILSSMDEETPISLFEDETEEVILTEIPHGTTVELIEEDENYSLIRFEEEAEEAEETLEWTGVVYSSQVQKPVTEEIPEAQESDVPLEEELPKESSEEQDLESASEEEESASTEESSTETEELNAESEVPAEEKIVGEADGESEAIPAEKEETTAETEETVEEKPAAQARTFSMTTLAAEQILEGIALKNPTSVYSSTKADASVLKSYGEGHILKFKAYDSNWFKATVYVKGKAHNGYIKAGDVSQIEGNNKLAGYAETDTLNVYSTTSRNSNVLKNYDHGHALIFRTYSSEWFKATVYVEGQVHTGYINIDDISFEKPAEKESASEKQSVGELLTGIATAPKVRVYSKTSRDSSVLKSYKSGHILKYRTYDDNWYQATVYVNGKAHSGYINAADVSNIEGNNKLTGYAKVDTLNVHESTSSSSKVLKSYKYGHALIFRTFSSEWFKATVYVDGKARTGYINIDDISFEKPSEKEAESEKQNIGELLEGIAAANPVRVYSETSRNSSTLKSYKKGKVLLYRALNGAWYQATVYVNGKAHTGYIHSADVENVVPVQTTVKGIGAKNKNNVYSSPSESSGVLKSYSQGHILTFKTFTTNWYEATVVINSKRTTGYINKNDIETITSNPKTVKGTGIKSPTNVYSKPNTGSKVVKSYAQYSALTYKTFTSGWYQASVYVNGVKKTGYISKADIGTPNGKTVVLDPGHGGKDPGAQALGLVEKQLVLDIGLRTEELLKNAGYKVIMTRTTDVFLELHERSQIANSSNADIFVSIHGNAFNSAARGIETFWYGKYERTNSMRLANLLQNNMVRTMGLSYRRVAEGNYHVIRETKVPSSLVEVGFLDNPTDAAKLKQSKYRQYAAEGIFAGIVQYFK